MRSSHSCLYLRMTQENIDIPEAEHDGISKENMITDLAIQTPSLVDERTGNGVLPETITFRPASETLSERANDVDDVTLNSSTRDQFGGETWSNSSGSEKVQLERYQGIVVGALIDHQKLAIRR